MAAPERAADSPFSEIKREIYCGNSLRPISPAKSGFILSISLYSFSFLCTNSGDEFSLADLSHLPNTQYLVTAANRAEIFTSKQNVGRWWDEISSRDSWKKVVEMQKSS
ncbi:hypothetical protein L484_007151 [Morus notabilis]|uniref:glutathione transferase n=1 Tax=Morus notabilis TaxID=981085 RepID=W9RZ76_9ROSA|nr:hypothetical protein L484_007151 [Morus notabilis]